jgi:acyl-CoA-binding protein
VDGFQDEMKSFDFDKEKLSGYVDKSVGVDDHDQLLGDDDSTKPKLDNNLQAFLNEDCCDNNVEIVDVTEIPVEEESDINNGGFVVCECEDKVFDERTERGEATTFRKVGITKIEELEVLKDDKLENKVPFDEDEDWEGIEKSKLHKVFGDATVFVESESNVDRIGSDLKLQLCALHKVATEGPCHESQPMALKVSARAKWNAWKNLGNMSPEEAMEQYINLLSKNIHGWMHDEKLESEYETLLPNRQRA